MTLYRGAAHQAAGARRPDRRGGQRRWSPAATPTSTPGPAAGTVLDVPTYSQMTHGGHYPQWGGGGEAWCSPTSTWRWCSATTACSPARSPTSPPATPTRRSTTRARMVYDHRYGGTGNWAFNTAYASTLTSGDAYVTRLRDLREAEDFIAAGIPLVVSVAFGAARSSPARRSPPATATSLVVVGFEADGDVVVNDPAGASNGAVRRVYDRDELEDVPGSTPAAARRTSSTRRQPLPPRSGAHWRRGRVNSTVCQPGRAVGHDVRDRAGLHLAVAPDRPHPQDVVARGDRRRCPPTAPRCRRWGSRPSWTRSQAPPSSATSTAAIPVCCFHATPPTSTRPGSTSAPDAGDVDARGDLDRPLLGPAALGPEGRDVGEAGHLEVDDPLGRRDVAVEPRDDRADREAVLDRQRPAVHGDRQHRVAVVGERGERGGAGPAVLRGLQHAVGVRRGRRPRASRSAIRTPLHQALPTRPPPTSLDTQLRVTHASVSAAGDEVVVGQHQLAVDHPVDAQPPVLGLDRRHRDGGVDEVEVVVGRLPRRESAQPDRRRGRRAGDGDAVEAQQPPALHDVAPAARRPRRPASPTPTAATPSTPATIRKTRRSRDSSSGLGRRPSAAARSGRAAAATQVTRPTSDRDHVDRTGAPLQQDRDGRRPRPAPATPAGAAPTSVRASTPASANMRQQEDQHAQPPAAACPADRRRRWPLGDRPGREPDDQLGDRDHGRLADGEHHRHRIARRQAGARP